MSYIPSPNNVYDLIENVAHAHLQIKTFVFGQPNDVDGIDNIVYPALVVIPRSTFIGQNTIRHTFEFVVADLINPDVSNRQEVWSDTNQILTDLVKVFRSYNPRAFWLYNEPTLEPFTDDSMDAVTGWRTNLEIEFLLPDGVCGLPMSAFTMPGTVGYQVSQYCTNLSGNCDTNILNPTDGQVLTWNGSFWINEDSTGGSGGSFTGGTVTGATSFTNGLTANTISATTYQNLPTDIRVTGGTYSNGTAIFTNNTGGTFNLTGFSTATNFTGGTVTGATNFTGGLTANTISATTYQNLPTYSIQTYMFTNIASNISNNKEMISLAIYVSGSLATTAVTVTTTPTLLGSFATNSGYPNTTIIPSGLFNCHFETQKSAGSNNYYTYYELYKISSGGTETLLGTSDNSSQTSVNTVIQSTLSLSSSSNIALLTSDRLIIKIYAVMLSASATITLRYDDNTNARFETPSTLNNVSNLVPYNGATSNINLGTYSLTANTISATTYNGLPCEIQIACSDLTTALTSGTTKAYFRSPYTFTLTEVRASLLVAQTSGNTLTVDINKSGTTILSTKLTIDNTEKTSLTAVTPPVISVSTIASDDEITIDLDVVGSSANAKGLVVLLKGVR